jgi:hypothetical protein
MVRTTSKVQDAAFSNLKGGASVGCRRPIGWLKPHPVGDHYGFAGMGQTHGQIKHRSRPDNHDWFWVRPEGPALDSGPAIDEYLEGDQGVSLTLIARRSEASAGTVTRTRVHSKLSGAGRGNGHLPFFAWGC